MSKQYLHTLLIRTYGAHKKKSRQGFQKFELSDGQPKILSILKDMEGCSQKELAEACRVEPATMTSLLKNMEQKGLIRKEAIQVAGQRAYSVYLTELGRKRSGEVMDIVDELEMISFQGFTNEEKEQFFGLLSRIYHNLDK